MTVRLTVSDILDQRGISTSDFAGKAKLTYGQALAIRRGVYERIDLGTIARICDALSVEPGALFTSAKPIKIESTETN
jgi:DNA-binding Xre family transcriptional regulator